VDTSTGATKTILSRDLFERLPELSDYETHSVKIFLSDGREFRTCGSATVAVQLGSQILRIRATIADIADGAILGMDALSQVNAVVETLYKEHLLLMENI